VSYKDFYSWVFEKKVVSDKRDELLDKHKPLPKAQIIKEKTEVAKQGLKTILKSEDINKRLEDLRNTCLIKNIHVGEAINEFKRASNSGFLNKIEFTQTMKALILKN
jgi:hypothetical protein